MPLETTTVALINGFKDQLFKTGATIVKEIEFFIDNGLSSYVENFVQKIKHTKTFVYRDQNISFYDTYFPAVLKDECRSFTPEDYRDLFEKSNFATILGSAGMGKTMVLKHLFLNAIEKGRHIPLYIELRVLNDFDGDIEDYINDVILNNKLSPDKKVVERLLNSGQFLLILDAYDEIINLKKNRAINSLERFVDRFANNLFIISSRPESGIESLPRFTNYRIQEIENEKIYDFIDLVVGNSDDKMELGKDIKIAIKRDRDFQHDIFLRNPLLLSMFIVTYRNYPRLPVRTSKFYWNVFDTLISRHDSHSKKGLYKRERKANLENEDYEKILQWLAYKSLLDGKIEFDIEYITALLKDIKKKESFLYRINDLIDDLVISFSLIVLDGVVYKFPHKSFQEYFASALICMQTEEDREKIYRNRLKEYALESSGGQINFWTFCHEMDKNTFTTHFLSYHIQSAFRKIRNKDKVQQMDLIINYLDLFILIEDEEMARVFKRALLPEAIFLMSLFEFLTRSDRFRAYYLDDFFLDWQVIGNCINGVRKYPETEDDKKGGMRLASRLKFHTYLLNGEEDQDLNDFIRLNKIYHTKCRQAFIDNNLPERIDRELLMLEQTLKSLKKELTINCKAKNSLLGI